MAISFKIKSTRFIIRLAIGQQSIKKKPIEDITIIFSLS
jgi:hypothetical protein